MNPMLQKLVDSEFMTQEQGEVIQKAVDAKDSVIASGHRSAAVRPLLATLMAMTKPYTSKKIKSLDDIGGKKTQDDTGTSTAKFVDDWNKKHSDSPSTIDYSGEDVTKRLLDLDSGEFDYLIFDNYIKNAVFYRTELLQKLGGFVENLKIYCIIF